MKRTDRKFDTDADVKRHEPNLHSLTFIVGELYLFHPTKRQCPSRGSLWGIYDKTEAGVIYLESSSRDLRHYRIRHGLSSEYRYCRRATRSELRDYMYNLGYSDAKQTAD